MRVLAIDPGYDRIGIAVMTKDSGTERILFSTCLITDRTDSFSKRLHQIGSTVEDILATYSPTAVAIETLFFNKNVKTAISVAEARGVILYLAQKAQCQIFEYSPQQIKVAVTGHGGSDKTAVISMIKRLIPETPTVGHDDEYDAIAVGITCLAHYRHDQ